MGKQLLDVEYAALRDRARPRELLRALGRARVRADLAALFGHKHPPYPFALPHLDFYWRCGQFRHANHAGSLGTVRLPTVLAAWAVFKRGWR